MDSETQYLVPDYYPGFTCKCGDCRRTCCQKWRVNLTLAEYDRLVGLSCSPDLRHHLDGCAYPEEHPSADRYASLLKRPDGFCSLLSPDGYCMLQRECGEEVLPSVCRYFPRSPRQKYGSECSCSCGCEGVVEVLFHHKGPLTFVNVPLSFAMTPEPHDGKMPTEQYRALRSACFSVMNRTDLTLAQRLWLLYDEVASLGKTDLSQMAVPVLEAGVNARSLSLQRTLSRVYGRESRFIQEYAAFADTYFFADAPETDPDRPDTDAEADWLSAIPCDFENRCFVPSASASVLRYENARAHFAAVYPDFDNQFSRVLVNHMFYTCFPLENEGGETPESVYLSLIACYALVRYVCIGCLAGSDSIPDLVDVVAALFRMVEGSGFTSSAHKVLRRYGNACRETLTDFIGRF